MKCKGSPNAGKHLPLPRWNDGELEWNPLDVRHPAPVKVYEATDKSVSMHLNDRSAVDKMKDGIVLKEYKHKKKSKAEIVTPKYKGEHKMDMPPVSRRYVNPKSDTYLLDIKSLNTSAVYKPSKWLKGVNDEYHS